MPMRRALPFVTGLALAVHATAAGAADLGEMAGQMIVVGFQGDDANDPWPRELAAMIARGELGGVMYLRSNVASQAAVRAMNRQFLDAAPAPALPPLIALDQEGGQIERLTAAIGFEEIPSAAWVGEHLGSDQAERVYAGMARALADLGFNLNLAPVVDLNANPANPIIARYGRAFSADAGVVTELARALIAGHHSQGVLTALKHFPGHGSSNSDTHEGFVDISATWHENELVPFAALIEGGAADMVMVGHLAHRDFAEGGVRLPASLSARAIGGLLRDRLGFDGVVISDDLEMGAIRANFGRREAVIRAVNAGTDLLLFSNTAEPSLALPGEILDILVTEAARDPAFRARIEQSYARIVALKSRLKP